MTRLCWRLAYRTPLPRLLFPRRFHAFGIGTSKSGTHSVANILARSYRSDHEMESFDMLPVVLEFARGRLPEPALRRGWRGHDRRCWLEFEAAHYLTHVVELLVDMFPDARFVLTIRDCYSWLDSEINQILRLHRLPLLKPFDDLCKHQYLGHGHDFTPHDQVLEQHGLFPLEGMLAHWRRHNEMALHAVPADRLLVLRTVDIARSVNRLTGFLDLEPIAVDTAAAHTYKRPRTWLDVYATVDPVYIDGLAQKHAAELMATHYPDLESVHDFLAARPDPAPGNGAPTRP